MNNNNSNNQVKHFKCTAKNQIIETKAKTPKILWCMYCLKFHEKKNLVKMRPDKNGVLYDPLTEPKTKKHEKIKDNPEKKQEKQEKQTNYIIRNLYRNSIKPTLHNE